MPRAVNNDDDDRRLAGWAWRGYLLTAASVGARWSGLADGPEAALSVYALLLLGVACISFAMLAPRPMERVREEEEDRAVVDGDDGNHQEEVSVPDAGTLSVCGYLLVAASVVAGWAGLADELGTAFLVYALLLLGVAFINLAMFAPAKLKTM